MSRESDVNQNVAIKLGVALEHSYQTPHMLQIHRILAQHNISVQQIKTAYAQNNIKGLFTLTDPIPEPDRNEVRSELMRLIRLG